MLIKQPPLKESQIKKPRAGEWEGAEQNNKQPKKPKRDIIEGFCLTLDSFPCSSWNHKLAIIWSSGSKSISK